MNVRKKEKTLYFYTTVFVCMDDIKILSRESIDITYFINTQKSNYTI